MNRFSSTSAPIEFSEGRVVGVDDWLQESVIHTPRAPVMLMSSMSCLSLPDACTYIYLSNNHSD